MPAAKLNYVHDFRGMYNCVSQVIYFHDPEYQRRPQVDVRVGVAHMNARACMYVCMYVCVCVCVCVRACISVTVYPFLIHLCQPV